MVKHTKTIHRQFADELFECFDHFVGLALKELKNIKALTKISFTLVRVFFMQLYMIFTDIFGDEIWLFLISIYFWLKSWDEKPKSNFASKLPIYANNL